jgi:hypothetical protein
VIARAVTQPQYSQSAVRLMGPSIANTSTLIASGATASEAIVVITALHSDANVASSCAAETIPPLSRATHAHGVPRTVGATTTTLATGTAGRRPGAARAGRTVGATTTTLATGTAGRRPGAARAGGGGTPHLLEAAARVRRRRWARRGRTALSRGRAA